VKVTIVCVGFPKGPIAEAIADYERRIPHYFGFEAIVVKETPHRGQPVERVVAEEGERLLARVPDGAKVIALDRPGGPTGSEALSNRFRDAMVEGAPGFTFVIGGAYGLSRAVLDRSDEAMSLSTMTLPHELARLVLTEQIYRAGTIMRGEPYHKGGEP
jgi:23S rRNA (pseudouridine1915-N3)-methyltransferase